jgi:hypothetical protein
MSFLGGLAKTLSPGYMIGDALLNPADPGKKQLAGILKQYSLLQNQQKVGYANALAQQQKGLGAIKTGYTNALNTVGAQGLAAKQSVTDRETRNVGALKSGLADSGMLGGTLGANLERGIYSDTSRSLSNIDAQIAQIRSGLQTEQANALAGQYGAMAGLHQGLAGAQTGLGQGLIQTLGNVQYQDPNAWLGSLFQIGGQLGTASLLAGSDRRLKRDAVRIDGLEWEFSYIGQEGRYRGVMADEVEHIAGAVHEIDGYKHVDYSRVPVAFRRVA